MNDKEELKQIYDIFTDCWRLYKKLYPPGRPEDDVYWQGVVKEIEVLRKNHHHSRLSRQSDIISMVLKMDDVELLDLAFGFVRGCYNQQIKKEQEAENNGEM